MSLHFPTRKYTRMYMYCIYISVYSTCVAYCSVAVKLLDVRQQGRRFDPLVWPRYDLRSCWALEQGP